MIHKSMIAAGFVILLAAGVAAGLWSYAKKTALPQSGSGVSGERIVIGNIGEYSLFNLIAAEKGYFRANGLDAQIKEYDAGPASVNALLAGEVDVAVAAEFVGVNKFFENQDLRILTASSKNEVFRLIARRDRQINGPSDLKDKKIGVTRKSAGEFHLGNLLTFSGLDLKDVNIIDLPPESLVESVKKGELDAIVVFDPHAYKLQKEFGNALWSWSAQEGQKTFALIYSTDSFIRSHPDVAERYLQALIQAEEYVRQNSEEAKELTAQLLNYESEYIAHMWGNFTFAHSLEQELLLSMEDQARWLIENGLVHAAAMPNYLDFIYFEALEKVKPEAVGIIK